MGSLSGRLGGLALALLIPIGSGAAAPAEPDLHGATWLDDTYAPRAVKWAKAQSDQTLAALRADPRFEQLRSDAEDVLVDPSRIPEPVMMAGAVYDYRQDRDRPLGVWRRSATDAFLAGRPDWETVLDLDALSASERKVWIFAGATCRERRCLVRLSENGKDATAVREFDLDQKAFVNDGFALPVGKSRAWWYDADTLLVAPVLGKDSLNASLLPRTLRAWKRGTPVARAPIVYQIGTDDAMLSVSHIRAGGSDGFIAARHIDFERREYRHLSLDGASKPLPLPEYATIMGVHDGRLLFRPNVDWTVPGTDLRIPAGVVAGIGLAPLIAEGRIADPEILFVPAGDDAVRSITAGGNRLFVELLHDYRSRIVELERDPEGRGWKSRILPLEADRYLQPIAFVDGRLLMRVEGLLSPEKLVLADPRSGISTTIYERSPAFDASRLVSEIRYTASADGTPIAYSLVRRGDLKPNGGAPTLIYGYGGYDVPVTPRYEPLFGSLWLERGGVYVHAYLRGGGEHGPAWHRGAMRENRQQPFDDMAAIIRDLHRLGISAPAHTGIMGRSNGGLMVAAVMQQVPGLMNAAIVGGPLIDMLNFHMLPPGGTWTAEYGDPRDPEIRGFLGSYSPMQNVARNGTTYPKPLIITAIDDDRVLPGHARRFSERLTAFGHPNLYYESSEGGHYWELAGGPAPGDWRLRSLSRAVEFTYLWKRLDGE